MAGLEGAMRLSGKRAQSAKSVELDLLVGGILFHSDDFRQIVEKLPVALYTTDAEGRITYFNEAAAALWGRSPKIGVDLWCGSWRLFWPDGRPMAHDECPMAETLRTGRPALGAQAIAERPDGTRFLFTPYPSPLYDATGQMIGAVNMLFDISEWSATEQALQHLAAIVQSSDDAIISKDLTGTITSWNGAAERLFGFSAREMIGKSILTIIPDDRRDEEDLIIGRIRRGEPTDHYETVRQRKDGSLVDVALTVSPVKDRFGRVLGASKIARDISERKLGEAILEKQARKLATLYRVSRLLSRDLDLDRIAQTATDIGTELSGARFGAFFHKIRGECGEEYQLFKLSGAPREAFEKFAMPRKVALFEPAFVGNEIVRSDDIRKDARFGNNALDRGMPEGELSVVSYLAVPVISSGGDVLGAFFFGHDEPGTFQEETEGLIAAIASQAAAAIDNARLHRATEIEIAQRRRAEQANELLVNEIKHRVKNTLGTVQALAIQSFRQGPIDERNAFVARLHALSEAHDVLTQRDWGNVALSEITERALLPFIDKTKQRISTSGVDAELGPNRALLIAMVSHELGTNAVKYGALSNDGGTVDVVWSFGKDRDERRLKLDWTERGGPPVAEPTHKGFGSRMIDHAIRGEQGTSVFTFAPEGLHCRIEIPV